MIEATIEWLATHSDAASVIGVLVLCAAVIGFALLAYYFRDVW